MAVGTTELAASGTGIGAGVGTTLLVRRQLDRSGETTVARPSVLWGVGTGVLSIGASMWMRNGRRGFLWEALEDYGEAALTAGLISAFSPKGTGVRRPTL